MRKAARWLLPEIDEIQAAHVAAELRMSPVAARVLVRRGYADPSAAQAFLHPTLDSLHSPSLLLGMDRATARIIEAVDKKEPILLYGDYDVDGTLSIVLLKKAIEIAGGNTSHHVPHRLREGYGMRSDVIQAAAQHGVKLIVSVDTGIRAGEVVVCAKELGVDVIVTDHHLPEAELPPAVAVLNPNQPGCGYPNKNLCGAGVAFKLAHGLLERTGLAQARLRRLLESFLKLVAIATVADVVALTGENRAIVKQGLAGLDKTANPGLRALLDVAGFQNGAAPNAGQVAFRVAPRINAAGRMDTAQDVIELFSTQDLDRARVIASKLNLLNAERQKTEQDMLSQILEQCESAPIYASQRALVFAGAGWHRGVIGIVASRLVERFHRPVFVLGIDEERGEAQGSGRSIPAFHLLNALESMPDLFLKFGGHRQAAGLTLRPARLEEFRERFNVYSTTVLTAEDLCPQYEADAELSLREWNGQTIADLFAMAPFGFGNPPPTLVVREVALPVAPTVMKEKHLRFRAVRDGATLYCKAWNWADRIGEFPVQAPLDLLFMLEDDGWDGVSASVKDVRSGNPIA